MKNSKLFSSLKGKSGLFFAGTAILLLINLTFLTITFQSQNYLSYLTDAAQKQHQLLRGVAYSNAWDADQESLLEFETIVSTFLQGGKIAVDAPYRIEDLPAEAAQTVTKLSEKWEGIKSEWKDRTVNDATKRFDAAQLIKLSERLADELAFTEQQAKSEASQRIAYMALIDLLLLAAAFFMLRQLYFKKVEALSEVAKKVSEGTIAKAERIELDDEIGVLSHALKDLTLHLENASDFVRQIGDGKLDSEYKYLTALDQTNNGLSSALLKMQANMKRVAEEDQQRNWASQGLTNFVDILRSHGEIQQLGDVIMTELTQYMHANQGSLYVLEEKGNQQVLKQITCFAFDRKKFLEKEIMVGEGLLGQSVIEKHTYYMTEVPQDYMRITSGLGDACPNAVLIVPLIVNDEVLGAVELATFGEFAPHEIKFVEKLGENIASSLKAVKVNERTQRLLEESQQQAELLRSQEEEMRQNMEELSATQEEMSRKEREMAAQLEAINISNAMVEFSPDGIVQKVNSLFEGSMGYSEAEVVGQHHRIFIPENEQNSEAYATFWRDLSKGEQKKGEFKRIDKGGKAIWLEGAYTPVKNDAGEVIKVIKLAINISERKALQVEADEQMQQMQAQEEELRQNMEELCATQENLESRMLESQELKNELDARMKALDETALLSESDLYGNIIYVNKKFCEVAKYTADEVMGKAHNIIRHPDTPKEVFKELWETIKAGKIFQGSYPNRAKDGSTYWVDATVVPVLDDDGKPVKYIGIRMDITDREDKRIEVKRSLRKNSEA